MVNLYDLFNPFLIRRLNKSSWALVFDLSVRTLSSLVEATQRLRNPPHFTWAKDPQFKGAVILLSDRPWSALKHELFQGFPGGLLPFRGYDGSKQRKFLRVHLENRKREGLCMDIES